MNCRPRGSERRALPDPHPRLLSSRPLATLPRVRSSAPGSPKMPRLVRTRKKPPSTGTISAGSKMRQLRPAKRAQAGPLSGPHPAGWPLLPRVWRRDLKGCERHGAGTLTSQTPSAMSSARGACFIHSFTRSLVRSVPKVGPGGSGPRVFRDVPRPTLPLSSQVAGQRRTSRQAEGGRAPAGIAVRVSAGPVPPARTHTSCLGPSEASSPFCPHRSRLVGLIAHSPLWDHLLWDVRGWGAPSLHLHHADEHVEGDATSITIATELGLEPV